MLTSFKMKSYILLFALLFSTISGYSQVNYLEESETDFAERMNWFTDSKYGLFIHFGLYSQLTQIPSGR